MAISPNLRGIGAVILATAAFVANDTCMKLALSDSPPFQVLVMRGIAALLWCLPVILAVGLIRELPKAFNPWVVLRSLSEVAAILCFISALGHMPIADVTAIAQIAPLLVLLGMWLFFGERVGSLRLGLVGLGITGALLVAQPGGEAASPFAILGFFTAVGAAGRDILSRKVPARTPALVVTFSTLLIVMLGAALMSFLFETQVQPTFRHGWLMFIAGFFLMCGHSLVFMAYRIAPARVVAPFNYSFMIWAGLSGLLVFGDVPNGLALAGMALILAAGLAVVLLEGRSRQGGTAPVKG
ncbi:DMT family transporter [Aestuariivirga sp.]|jgi:drug/metabolite transporter (DMT)-like permease|uniref:DMT family transporter n=1 Tax=Aestuariivirga sp. TaxID=2650926 RepID=UPI0037835E3C